MSADPLLAAVRDGIEVIDLAQPLTTGMPCSPNQPGFRMTLARRHGDMVRSDGGSSANETIITGGHVGTHIDALAHVSQDGRLYGGVDCMAAQTGGTFTELGADAIPPRVCHGTLLDVAALHGTESLPGGHGITADELAAAADRVGVRPEPGGVCLVHTGWGRWWSADPDGYIGLASGVPGITPEAAHWLVRHGVAAVGADTTVVEQVHPGRGHATLPVHRILLVEHAVHLIEHLRLSDLAAKGVAEFTFVLAPLNIVGATGAPLRPLALLGGAR